MLMIRFGFVQGYHSKCGVADLLLSPVDDSEGSTGHTKLIIIVLASVHDECTERPALGGLWQGESPSGTCYVVLSAQLCLCQNTSCVLPNGTFSFAIQHAA